MAVNWESAVEKNLEALRRILAMLAGLIGMPTDGSDAGDFPKKTLPRHLHRYLLKLLRPAESATRRLIIIAARGLVVNIRTSRPHRPEVAPEPRTIQLLDPADGPTGSQRPEPVKIPASSRPDKRSFAPSLSLLDPIARFGPRRRHAEYGSAQSAAGEPAAPPPAASLDAGSIYRRLEAIRRVLDDLPGAARRMARWTAWRDARLAWEQIESRRTEQAPVDDAISLGPFGPASVLPDVSSISGCAPGDRPIPTLAPEISGSTEGGMDHRNGNGISGEERRIRPQGPARSRATALSGAVHRRADHANPGRRLHRLSPARPRHAFGWRRKYNHDAHEVLNEFHGLAAWAGERRDSS